MLSSLTEKPLSNCLLIRASWRDRMRLESSTTSANHLRWASASFSFLILSSSLFYFAASWAFANLICRAASSSLLCSAFSASISCRRLSLSAALKCEASASRPRFAFRASMSSSSIFSSSSRCLRSAPESVWWDWSNFGVFASFVYSDCVPYRRLMIWCGS